MSREGRGTRAVCSHLPYQYGQWVEGATLLPFPLSSLGPG